MIRKRYRIRPGIIARIGQKETGIRGRWVATIKKNRVQCRLDSFRNEIAAARAYDQAARELFGEHAGLISPTALLRPRVVLQLHVSSYAIRLKARVASK
jgi:hypothetical protein